MTLMDISAFARRASYVLAIVIIAMTSACAQRHVVATAPTEVFDARCQVKLRNGRSVSARPLPAPTGVEWAPTNGGKRIAESSVESFTCRDHGSGAVVGLGLGALVIGVPAALSVYAEGDSQDEDCLVLCKARDSAIVVGIVWGGLGGLVGTAMGAVIGTPVHYTMARSGPQVSARPTDGGAMSTLSWSF